MARCLKAFHGFKRSVLYMRSMWPQVFPDACTNGHNCSAPKCGNPHDERNRRLGCEEEKYEERPHTPGVLQRCHYTLWLQVH